MKRYLLGLLVILPVILLALPASASGFTHKNLCNEVSHHALCLSSAGSGNKVFGKAYKNDRQQNVSVINRAVCDNHSLVTADCPFAHGYSWNAQFEGDSIVSVQNSASLDCYVTSTAPNTDSPVYDLTVGCHHPGWLWVQVPAGTPTGYMYVNVGATNFSNFPMELTSQGKDKPVRLIPTSHGGTLASVWRRHALFVL